MLARWKHHWTILTALALFSGWLWIPARALDNGLARTPPMGWNGWNSFGCDVSEQLIKETADAMVSSGMRDVGYEYVIIDDCWQIGRASDGTIIADPERFPSGIKALADYVHARGLKLGIYTDAGMHTCQGRPGSLGYEQMDIKTYAAWSVDYVKVDWCYSGGLNPRTQYALWREALAQVERPLVFSICNWGLDSPWTWGRNTGNLWRTTYDIEDNWRRILEIADFNVDLAAYAGPGGWNDPDMLEVGNGGMTETEYRAHFSLWAIMAAPLIAGNDLRTMSQAARSILTNSEVIRVNQDRAGVQGTRVYDAGDLEVWARPLEATGERAVVLLNRGAAETKITVDWGDIGLAPGDAAVRDLWAHADLGSFTDSFTARVPPHGVVMVTIVGSEPSPPAGESYLSDLTWTSALNGRGPAERDTSNGEQEAGDGRPITLGGTTYLKGLGVHAASRIRFNLGGACSTLTADIGLDDEVEDNGSVVFEVWGDEEKLYDSGIMTGSTAAESVALSVAGKGTLQLVVIDAGDNNHLDHADWADARLACWATDQDIYMPLIWR
jgi:alpha-galactosidase